MIYMISKEQAKAAVEHINGSKYNIKQEIGKKAKNSQRSDCRLLFCKGKSHP